jgi:phosphoribosyl-AMP cyclohydrolase / phosphoribosyl-ATP pyrophosphohydrolase
MSKLDFDKGGGLIPAIIQDADTRQVLMLGYMNKEAYKQTQKEGRVTFYSRAKKRLWTKGETSGNFLELVEMLPDCDHDTLLVRVHPRGPVCHTGSDTCFDEANQEDVAFLNHLARTIKDRRKNPSEKSYTSKLFKKGLNKIAQKVGEEAVELIIEAKDENKDLFLGEAADLLYHLLVLLEAKRISLSEVIQVLESRHKEKTKSK